MLSACAVLNVQTACPFKQKRDIIKWSFFHLVAPLFKNAIIYLCPPFYAMKMLRYLFGWADTPKNDILINHVLRQLNRSEVGSAAELSVFRSFLDTCHLSLVAYES